MDPIGSGFDAGAEREPGAQARGSLFTLQQADGLMLQPAGDDSPADDSPGDDPGASLAPVTLAALDGPALALLIARVVHQDEAALASLYEQLSGRVYALALRITRQVGSAEEVLQDTFWQVWRQAPRFDATRGSAVAWVLMMARSRALDAVRARAHDPVQTSLQTVDDDDPLVDAGADDPLDLLQAVRRDSALHTQLALLDPLRRQLIALAFFRGLSQDEIALQMSLPLGTVKSHFRRTLAALQAALGPEFGLARSGGAR